MFSLWFDHYAYMYFPPKQEVTLKENEITALRKQIEREFLEKVKLEDNIMEKMRSQLTLDKAAQYTKKMTDRLRRRATELVKMMLTMSFIHVKKVKEKFLEVGKHKLFVKS